MDVSPGNPDGTGYTVKPDQIAVRNGLNLQESRSSDA